MDHGLDSSSSEGSGEDSVGEVIFEERRASVRAIVVTLTIWFAIIFVLGGITWVQINGSLALLVILLFLLFPLFSFISWVMFRMFIDSEKIQLVRTFIYRNKESLEFNKIEGVDIQQGPFGRAFDYGRLTISGVGIKQLRTEPIDHPDQVAREIRALIARR
jgi:membrane protein YdbS with pleckstrin-like domain